VKRHVSLETMCML